MTRPRPPIAPMEADTAAQLPRAEGWQYEPKWDGFRCLAFRYGDEIELQSKAGQPLARYFPDVVAALGALAAKQFVLDGELVIPVDGALTFSELQLRLHPAASRVRKLAEAHPAVYIVFDLLADERGSSLLEQPLTVRRQKLEAFARRFLVGHDAIRLSPATREHAIAARWLGQSGGDIDGVMAKRREAPYLSGERIGMLKVKQHRTADCVVGGFRYGEGTQLVGSLLLGLYDDQGLLNHVGFTASLPRAERAALTRELTPLVRPPGFTGAAPGGPSRWSHGRERAWVPVDPIVVVEVAYDHFTGGRFRHGTQIVRFRPDKEPRQCTYAQITGGRRRRGHGDLWEAPG